MTGRIAGVGVMDGVVLVLGRLVTILIAANASAADKEPPPARLKARPVVPLGQDYTVLWRASDPTRQIGYCPALTRLPNGRLVGSMLVAAKQENPKESWTIKVFTNDDREKTWVHRKDTAMVDGSPFVAASAVYVIGGREELKISRSEDWGETWSDPVALTKGKLWYSCPGSAVVSSGRI